MRKKFSGVKAILVLMLVAMVVLPAVAVSLRGLREDIFRADIALVLGNKVYANGTVAPRLAGRLDQALVLYKDGMCDRIIVSGGVGSSGFDEATAMRNYLAERGVPLSAIVTDSGGVNTRASVDFTVRYMRENAFDSVLVVTQFFHIPRAVITLKSYGISKVGASYARYFEVRDVYSTLREVPAIFAYSLGFK